MFSMFVQQMELYTKNRPFLGGKNLSYDIGLFTTIVLLFKTNKMVCYTCKSDEVDIFHIRGVNAPPGEGQWTWKNSPLFFFDSWDPYEPKSTKNSICTRNSNENTYRHTLLTVNMSTIGESQKWDFLSHIIVRRYHSIWLRWSTKKHFSCLEWFWFCVLWFWPYYDFPGQRLNEIKCCPSDCSWSCCQVVGH